MGGPRSFPWVGFLAISFLVFHSAVGANEPTSKEAEFFTSKIEPILKKNCFSCHSHEAKRSRGGLMLDTRTALLEGGDTGPALVPGDTAKSLLVRAISYTDDELQMPPKAKMPEADIALLTEWVKMGAPWPGPKTGDKVRRPGGFTDEDRKWWAIQPLKKAVPPDVKDARWTTNPIDRFVFSRLEAEGIKPSPQAERRVLIRRLSYDLTGLPPAPEEVDRFVTDKSPNAVEQLVDRLLNSPRFGEHWARHWLDLVRYAESDGFRLDEYRPHSWRYRDYVIRAFNEDKPYNRFVMEQIAGDELDATNPDVLVATAYLRHGIYEYNQRDVRTQWQDILDDVTNVTGEVFLGLGVGCARCHDHKYDPILQKDYYRLQAFFTPLMHREDTPLATPEQLKAYQEKLAVWEAKTVKIRAELDALLAPIRKRVEKDAIDKFPKDIQAMLRKAEADRLPLEKQLAAVAYRQVQYEFDHIDKHVKDAKAKERYKELTAQLAVFDKDRPAPLPVGLTVTDVGPVAPATYIPRKSVGKPIEPGPLSILNEQSLKVPEAKGSTGRRLALAKWIASPEHPLTSRVLVNRLWQQLFGRGLVPTPSDFGRLGDPPSHPELLDYLANRFVEDGWSMKKTIRLIVMSQAYQQSSLVPNANATKKDPENRLIWRGTTRRLTAEQIRDSILSATGQLDLKSGGPSVDGKEPRRTIYTKVRRNTRDPLLDVFDAPEGFTSTGTRNVTTTPVQALLMLNSPFMVEQGKKFADRVRREKSKNDDERIGHAFRLAFGRDALPREIAATQGFLTQQTLRVGGDSAAAREGAFLDFCQALLHANEFVYID